MVLRNIITTTHINQLKSVDTAFFDFDGTLANTHMMFNDAYSIYFQKFVPMGPYRKSRALKFAIDLRNQHSGMKAALQNKFPHLVPEFQKFMDEYVTERLSKMRVNPKLVHELHKFPNMFYSNAHINVVKTVLENSNYVGDFKFVNLKQMNFEKPERGSFKFVQDVYRKMGHKIRRVVHFDDLPKCLPIVENHGGIPIFVEHAPTHFIKKLSFYAFTTYQKLINPNMPFYLRTLDNMQKPVIAVTFKNMDKAVRWMVQHSQIAKILVVGSALWQMIVPSQYKIPQNQHKI